MITASKSTKTSRWTWDGKRFARKKPSECAEQFCKGVQLYHRARFYDPTTGEFISQDPLEYVDGMSMYRGYFAQNWTDPSGKFLFQVYGTYCGFSKNGPGIPIDSLDAACREHDSCLPTWDSIWRQPCRIGICNENLCFAATNAPVTCLSDHPKGSQGRADCLAYAKKILAACLVLGHSPPFNNYPDANGDGTPDVIGTAGCCPGNPRLGANDPNCNPVVPEPKCHNPFDYGKPKF